MLVLHDQVQFTLPDELYIAKLREDNWYVKLPEILDSPLLAALQSV